MQVTARPLSKSGVRDTKWAFMQETIRKQHEGTANKVQKCKRVGSKPAVPLAACCRASQALSCSMCRLTSSAVRGSCVLGCAVWAVHGLCRLGPAVNVSLCPVTCRWTHACATASGLGNGRRVQSLVAQCISLLDRQPAEPCGNATAAVLVSAASPATVCLGHSAGSNGCGSLRKPKPRRSSCRLSAAMPALHPAVPAAQPQRWRLAPHLALVRPTAKRQTRFASGASLVAAPLGGSSTS